MSAPLSLGCNMPFIHHFSLAFPFSSSFGLLATLVLPLFHCQRGRWGYSLILFIFSISSVSQPLPLSIEHG